MISPSPSSSYTHGWQLECISKYRIVPIECIHIYIEYIRIYRSVSVVVLVHLCVLAVRSYPTLAPTNDSPGQFCRFQLTMLEFSVQHAEVGTYNQHFMSSMLHSLRGSHVVKKVLSRLPIFCVTRGWPFRCPTHDPLRAVERDVRFCVCFCTAITTSLVVFLLSRVLWILSNFFRYFCFFHPSKYLYSPVRVMFVGTRKFRIKSRSEYSRATIKTTLFSFHTSLIHNRIKWLCYAPSLRTFLHYELNYNRQN